MRSSRIFYLFSISILLLTSCKKDEPSEPVTTVTVNESGNVSVAADASGAFYSILVREHMEPAGSLYDDYEMAMAWLGSATDMKDAGTVTINANSLANIGMGANFYVSEGSTLFNGNNTAWAVSGNAASGITGFNHADNTGFPAGGEFTLPPTIDITKTLTIAHTPTTGIVVYVITGEKGTKTKIVQESASSVTFSPAEMAEVAIPNDEITVGVMTVAISPAATYNGKKYYFVKQFQHLRYTETQ